MMHGEHYSKVHLLSLLVQLLLQLEALQRRGSDLEEIRGLEHKSQALVEIHRLQVHRTALHEGHSIRSVRGHAAVQRATSGVETRLALGAGGRGRACSSFGVIIAVDQAHVLAHAVAVEVRRPESLGRHHPSWKMRLLHWKNN